METKTTLQVMQSVVNIDPAFTKQVLDMRGGEKILDCIQCGVCSGSCPSRFALDFTCMQIIRMVLLGMKEAVFSSKTIWVCPQCNLCKTRCPRGIDLPLLMSTLKNIAIRENIPSKIETKPRFHKIFANIIKKYGRMHEPELTIRLVNAASPRELFRNAVLGFRLWRKGKVKLSPSKIKQSDQLSKIIESTLKEED
ncbi:MAG: 4Fe-4S dicluster domain-containing protein [Candidatus Bathyarchaeia archaeon]